MPAFPSWRSPDVTTTATEAAGIQLQLTTHLLTPERMKGWVGLVGWPIADGLPTYPRLRTCDTGIWRVRNWFIIIIIIIIISGHPSVTSRAQDSESTSAKDQCSTAGPHHQLALIARFVSDSFLT